MIYEESKQFKQDARRKWIKEVEHLIAKDERSWIKSLEYAVEEKKGNIDYRESVLVRYKGGLKVGIVVTGMPLGQIMLEVLREVYGLGSEYEFFREYN